MTDLSYLIQKAEWVWRETLKIHKQAPETRIASSLSPVEIFVSLYYGKVLSQNPENPSDDSRDRCIVSKGHGSICMYPILADLGFFSKSELQNVCKNGGFLGGIPDPVIPGYETVNGSLGHGLGVGTGIALALRTKNKSESVFVVSGDGELHEGANWEAIMFASHHKLDKLNLVVDNNSTSMLDHTDNIVSHMDLPQRFQSFGWEVYEIDGHDISKVFPTLKQAKESNQGRPKVVIANTIKGRGIPGVENEPLSHIMNPGKEILDSLLKD